MSTVLTEHFNLEEFQLDGPMPAQSVPVYKEICEQILEPIRLHFGAPIVITSGYRPPSANSEAGGVAHSQHMATAVYGAADFCIPSLGSIQREVFDAIRNSSAIPFDQVILETNPGTGNQIVHVSWTFGTNRREALEGETNNLSAYKMWSSAPAVEA